MNAQLAYQQTQAHNVGHTRIDLLLALYDGAIERLNRAIADLNRGDRAAAFPLIARAQLIVGELTSGVRVGVDPELGTNMLRLYDFVTHQLRHCDADHLQDAVGVLCTLREGFQTIRPEAVALERSGQIPPVNDPTPFLAEA